MGGIISFRTRLGRTISTRAARDLDKEAFQFVLTLHMAALVAVDAQARGKTAPADPVGLSAYLAMGRPGDANGDLARASASATSTSPGTFDMDAGI